MFIYHNNGKHKLALFPFPLYEVITKHIGLEPQGFGSSEIQNRNKNTRIFQQYKSELETTKKKKSEKAKNSDRIETDDFVIVNNTVRKLTDLGNVLDSQGTLEVDSFKYEKGKTEAVRTINSHFLQ